MRVAWVTRGALYDRASGQTIPPQAVHVNGQWTSTIASVRLRALVPMTELQMRGHDVDLIQLDPDDVSACASRLADFDVVVFRKASSYGAATVELFRRMLAAGVPTVFDICDLHIDTQSKAGRLNQEFLIGAESIVASTASLAEAVRSATGRESAVIADPYEGPRGEPVAPAANGRINLLWFGHPSNLDTLDHLVDDLVAVGKARPIQLTIMTGPVPELLARCKKFNQRWRHVLSTRYERWSSTALWGAIAASDAVVIPSLVDKHAKLVKSANRMVESLWAGRCVVANPLPAYLPFADWAFVDESIQRGLARALAARDEIPARVLAAQAYIADTHAPRHIADQWERVLQHTVASVRARGQRDSGTLDAAKAVQ